MRPSRQSFQHITKLAGKHWYDRDWDFNTPLFDQTPSNTPVKPGLAVELARMSGKRRQATILCLPSGSSISAGLSQVWVLVLGAHLPVVRQVVCLRVSL